MSKFGRVFSGVTSAVMLMSVLPGMTVLAADDADVIEIYAVAGEGDSLSFYAKEGRPEESYLYAKVISDGSYTVTDQDVSATLYANNATLNMKDYDLDNVGVWLSGDSKAICKSYIASADEDNKKGYEGDLSDLSSVIGFFMNFTQDFEHYLVDYEITGNCVNIRPASNVIVDEGATLSIEEVKRGTPDKIEYYAPYITFKNLTVNGTVKVSDKVNSDYYCNLAVGIDGTLTVGPKGKLDIGGVFELSSGVKYQGVDLYDANGSYKYTFDALDRVRRFRNIDGKLCEARLYSIDEITVNTSFINVARYSIDGGAFKDVPEDQVIPKDEYANAKKITLKFFNGEGVKIYGVAIDSGSEYHILPINDNTYEIEAGPDGFKMCAIYPCTDAVPMFDGTYGIFVSAYDVDDMVDPNTVDLINKNSFKLGDEINIKLKKDPYKVMIFSPINPDLELEVKNKEIKYKPESINGFQLCIFETKEEYEYFMTDIEPGQVEAQIYIVKDDSVKEGEVVFDETIADKVVKKKGAIMLILSEENAKKPITLKFKHDENTTLKLFYYDKNISLNVKNDSYIWQPSVMPLIDVTFKGGLSGVEAFVNRLYSDVLGRAPEAEGAKFWSDSLLRFQSTGAQAAEFFIFSDEFTAKNKSDKEFIEILYKTFFNREPDQGGMDFWLSEIGSRGRQGVATDFIYSEEWANTCAGYGILSGGTTKATVDIAPSDLTFKFVERMYTTAMKRASDPSGKAFWSSELSNYRLTGEAVGVMFFLSDEMTALKLSNKEFVTRLYKTFMDREPEAEGFAFWVKFLDDGGDRSSVVYGFTRSEEFVNKCIEARILPY